MRIMKTYFPHKKVYKHTWYKFTMKRGCRIVNGEMQKLCSDDRSRIGTKKLKIMISVKLEDHLVSWSSQEVPPNF